MVAYAGNPFPSAGEVLAGVLEVDVGRRVVGLPEPILLALPLRNGTNGTHNFSNGTALAWDGMDGHTDREFYGVQAPTVLRDHIKITAGHTIMLHDAVFIDRTLQVCSLALLGTPRYPPDPQNR